MIVDFNSIKHDFYDKVEQPVLTIKTPDGRVISTISNYYELKPTFRFNDVSEVNFIAPAYHEGKKNNGYDEIYGMRLVEVEPYGDFILVNPKKNNEGGKKEIKMCKAYSLEYAFNYKKVNIPAGTYNFYNPINNKDTIINMIIELMPDWSIGEIDSELIGRWRTFDSVDDGLYTFMMNTLQESYNCIFLFDTFNKKINVKAASRSANNLPIYLSYDNLVKSIDVTELSEDIVTALSGYGSGEEVNIRSVNPNGTNTIYNLDYFISNGDIPDKLADKWSRYNEELELYQNIFSNIKTLHIQKINQRELAKSELNVLITERDVIKETYLTAQTNTNVDSRYDEEIARLKSQLDAKEAEIVKQNSYIADLDSEVTSVDERLKDVVAVCKLDSYFTTEEIKILTQYFKEDSIVDDSCVIPEYSAALLESKSNRVESNSQCKIKISGAEVYASDVAEVFAVDENGIYNAYTIDEESGETIYNGVNSDLFNNIELPDNVAQTVADQLNDEARRKSYILRGGIFDFNYISSSNNNSASKTISLVGDVVDVTFYYNTDNLITYQDESSSDLTKIGYFTLAATLHDAEYNGTAYPIMNFCIQGKILNNTPQMSDEFISFNIDSAIFYAAASNTEYQKQTIIQELYNYTKESLDKLAFPSYEFSVDSANFIFAKEFEPFKNQLELGSTINLMLDEDENNILQPILIEIGLNYDDETDFTITFSNKYRSSNSQFQLADLLTEMNRQTRSTTKNKADYKAYKDSKISNKVSNFTSSAIDVIKNKVINSSNQAIEWDSTGMFFRKALSGGGFAGNQIGIINENIAFTKNNWDSVEIAIGAYDDSNLGKGYGIIAPSIFGTLVAGENLQFQNESKSFIFDSTGAWLHNSSLAFTHEDNGGKILIDPRYGIAAGNSELFTLEDTNIKPNFWDEEKKQIIWDEDKLVVNEDGQSQYYVPLNTQFFFDINTGNAYFGGTLNAENVVAGTLNGSVIADGTVDAGSKLGGAVAKEQLAPNIVHAMNEYVNITEDSDLQQIDVKLIGNLEAINFKGEKIIANEIDAKNITGDLITAINVCADNAEFAEAKINVAAINSLTADNAWVKDLLTTGEIITNEMSSQTGYFTDYLTGVVIKGDIIEAGTLRTDRLIVKGTDGKYYDISTNFDSDYFKNQGVTPVEEDSIHGSILVAESITANKIAVKDLVAFNATIAGFKIRDRYISKNTDVFAADILDSIYLGLDGISLGGKFSVDSNGYLESTRGSIGGWDISDDSLYSEGNTYGSESRISLNSNGCSIILQTDDGIVEHHGHYSEYRYLDSPSFLTVAAGGIGVYNYTDEEGYSLGQDISFYHDDELLLRIYDNCIDAGGNSTMYFLKNRIDVSKGIRTDSYIAAGTRMYLANGYGLRGMKYNADYSFDADSLYANSNSICYIGENDRVIFGNSSNSTMTEIRSPYSILLKCNGTTLDESRCAIRFLYDTYKNVGYGYFMPTYNPDGTSYTNLGGANHKWRNVYTTNSEISTSDRKLKKNIQMLDKKYIELFDLIDPVSYKMIEGDRIHTGFIAQDVEEAMIQVGLTSKDFGGLCKDIKYENDVNGYYVPVIDVNGEYEYTYSLRYSEFIALNTAKIKQLEKIILQLQAEIEELKQ